MRDELKIRGAAQICGTRRKRRPKRITNKVIAGIVAAALREEKGRSAHKCDTE